jgi:ferrochelatase
MKTAVVLFNLGGPDSLAAVKPFLFNLFNDPAIIGAPKPIRYLLAKLISSRREKKAQAIYAQMGGRSPILPQTQAQAEALQRLLNANGDGEWRCFIAMRYWNPRAVAALQEVIAWDPDHVVLLPLYPQFSTTTTGSSLREWRELAASAGFSSPTTAVCCYHSSPDWIAALAEPTREAVAQAGDNPLVLFSAHGLPQKIVDAGDPYQWQVEQTVAELRQALAPLQFESMVCYQSRVGPLQWIGPSTDDCIAQAAKTGRNIVVVPVAFVSEHSETLVELDIEYRHLAVGGGAKSYTRVATVQVQTQFIAQLAQLAQRARADNGAIINGFDQPPQTPLPVGLCPPDATRCLCRLTG